MNKKYKIGFTCGSWDIIHWGFIEMFKECKEICDYLIVGLQTDPSIDRKEKNKPIHPLEKRKKVLEAIKYIDEIIIYSTEEDLYNLLKKLLDEKKIDIRIIGADWKGKKYTGDNLPIPIYFNERNHNWSASELRKRIYDAEKEKRENNPEIN